ncbi:hypothetical protein [Mobilicoccus pelagius]|uniref:Pyrrolo-quinoline quinone n=1 Tax=Mobilicoccus pelagius NBRC 104925 TaxID=1089455 RepID=H5UPZ3_9MICO|nr:hypothetical protein [Mobilicoccus pelagius]GAB47798.1 hypothetical protein MOPEL_029_00790 [Mobilicoccus pelagius NBRC 104925]
MPPSLVRSHADGPVRPFGRDAARPGTPPVGVPPRGGGRHRARTRPGASVVDHVGLPWLVGLGVVLLLVVTLSVWTLLAGRVDTIRDVARYPGTAPAEWGPAATWASPPLLPDVDPVVVGGDAVALVSSDRTLLLVSAADGTVRWRAALPEGDVHGEPALTRIDGTDVLALHVGGRLRWWETADGTHHETGIPEGSIVSTLGEVPLVATGSQVTPMTTRHARPVSVPPGMVALAAHEDGQITLAGPTGWAHLGPDGATRSHGGWENASSPAPTVLGYTGGFVLLVRPDAGGGPATVEAHADRTTDVRHVFGGPVVLPPDGRVTWSASPSGSWGVLGRALVDLRTGRVDDLGGWSTSTVTADRAYGHIEGQTVVVGPSIPRGVLASGEAIPVALTTAGALVRGPAPHTDTSAGTDPRRRDDTVYLLPARRTAS